ncbi:hypothetical protein [Neorhizobium sp. NCHU2750]|uniref:hypothetical protein n=1 Tax=Neorhizobium sp. NCHU2750 TaxID=1825976 RepID=UPI000E76B5B1|nr:hypothetical protein NCHU2750_19680 [Neorhizobium sp. NCHU2750]
MTATRDQFFKPEKTSAQAKAGQANSVLKSIIDAETMARDQKTEKLRALRLAQQEEQAAKAATARKGSRQTVAAK